MKTKLKPFDLEAALKGDSVVTDDGREVTEITEFKTTVDYKVLGVINGCLASISPDGAYHNGSCWYKLFMKPQQVTEWLNLYRGSGGVRTGVSTYKTEQEAKDAVDDFNHEYFSTIQITFEV